MKQRKIVLSLIATIALTAAGYLGMMSFNHEEDAYSSLLMQNIEALSNNEGTGLSCTGPKNNGECLCVNARPCQDLTGCN